MAADATAAHAWLTEQSFVDSSRIAAVGFCMGGRATFIANSELPLAAAISYYGGSIAPALLDRVPRLHAPHLFFWGGQDKGIPAEQRRAVTDALEAAGKLFVSVEFSDANHAFFNEQVYRYNEAAARQSWVRSHAFLLNISSTVAGETHKKVNARFRGEFGGEFLPAEYGIEVGQLRHRRPVSL